MTGFLDHDDDFEQQDLAALSVIESMKVNKNVESREEAGRREKLKMRIVEKFEKANRLARAILRNGERNDNKKNSPHSTYSCQCNIRN